jgi:hypothetical protein
MSRNLVGSIYGRSSIKIAGMAGYTEIRKKYSE